MPFPELFRLPKGKFDSTHDKNTNTCSTNPSFVPENDFVDIVWENGQISMSSRRARKVPATSNYAKFGTMDYEFRTPDDNMVHGFNCPFDESLPHGSCSDFISGVTANQVSTQNHVPSIGKRTIRSKVEDIVCNNMRHQKQDLVPPSTCSVSMNFPLFSLPAAFGEYGVRPPGKDKESAESTVVRSPAPEKVNLRPTEDMAVEKPVGTKGCQESILKAGGAMAVEPVLACSSVCSDSSVERPLDGERRDSKRKSRRAEDLEWPSEGESMDVKRAARSSKRSRAADVHNLSERVRRDRINEKMRALQELVPNCNKYDKASMLDEAIEYLKTLQLQVQMMSMGGGLYMPPMMMQQLHVASMVGVGMNYGIGIPDMMIQGGHFPSPHMFGPPTLGLPLSTHPFALSGAKDLMHNFNAQANAEHWH